MVRNSIFMACAALGVAACISPQDYETTPVEISTSKGLVTCQLYSPGRVSWDRSINRPENMSVQEADNVCISEGNRILAGG